MHNKSLPIGYVEIQRSWVGPRSNEHHLRTVQEAVEQMQREQPGLVQHGLPRLEMTPDGAGVLHYTVYVGFAPALPSSEPLDPRNLNNAENANQIGDPVRDNAIGMKENKF